MNTIHLKRTVFSWTSTIGKLTAWDLEFWTLEDTCRDRDKNNDGKLQASEKIKGMTAIPSGVYEIYLRESKRYGRPMPFLKDVPHYDGIMIHPLNIASQTEGCIGVGLKHTVADRIDQSKDAFNLLFPKIESALKAGPLFISIAGGYTKEEREAKASAHT